MSDKKLIILVIDDDSNEIYSFNKQVWKRLIKILDNKCSIYFIRFSNQYNVTTLIDDTIYVYGTESYIPGILHKTIEAFRFCQNNFNVDFYFRTNISSMIYYNKLIQFINTINQKIYISAIIGPGPFPSGSGYVISKDLVDILINNTHKLNYDVIDDVAVGLLLNTFNIKITEGKRYDFDYNNILTPEDIYNNIHIIKQHYHYRIKMDTQERRQNEHILMNSLIDLLY
jgi:hypothetical protein